MAGQDELALIMTTEMGKPLAEAKGEVPYAAEFFRWFAEGAVRIGGDFTSTGDGKNRILVSKEPVGPCVLVTKVMVLTATMMTLATGAIGLLPTLERLDCWHRCCC